MMAVGGYTSHSALVKKLGKSPAWLSNLIAVAEGRGRADSPKHLPFKEVIFWALDHGVSIDWLLTGQERVEATSVSEPGPAIQRATDPNNSDPPSPDVARDVGMAWSILESGKGEAKALQNNIHSFYKGAFSLEALKDQVGLDGLSEEYRREYLLLKKGGGKVPKFYKGMDGSAGTKRRRKTS